MGDAEVDQSRFFAAGDDFNRMAQDFLGAADKFATVVGFAQGVGADDAHCALRQAGGQLGEAAQAVDAALHGFLTEHAPLVDTGSQLHLVPQALEDTDLAVVGLGQDHMEAVGAQVDGCNQGK
ncbi:hypothetical protein FQZ97_960230 [compost metagenome]